MSPLCRLNLVFGPAVEAAVTAALLAHEPELPGFTLLKAEGHGHDFAHASIHERVRGHVQRRVLWMVLPRAQARAVLDDLRGHVGADALLWWIEPVEDFGRLA